MRLKIREKVAFRAQYWCKYGLAALKTQCLIWVIRDRVEPGSKSDRCPFCRGSGRKFRA